MTTPISKLIKKEFVDKEWRWTYKSKFIFNFRSVVAVTITDHYQQKKGREKITNDLILEMLEQKLHGQKVNPMPDSYHLWGKSVFLWNTIYQGQRYRLIFWFKHGTTDHLWIRNCYQMS